MAERRVHALTLEIDADNGRAIGTLAELEAYLKALRDETVNIDIDVDARQVNALRKTFKATEGDLIALERYLKKSEATLDRRSKLFKSLNPLTQEFLNNNWKLLKSNKANEEGVQDLSDALKDARNAYAATASVVQDLNERQRIAARGHEKEAKLAKEVAKAQAEVEKGVEQVDAAYRKQIATQQRAIQENEKYDLEMSKLVQRHAELQDQMARTAGRSAFLKTPQDIAKIERLRAEMGYVREQYRRMGGDMAMLDSHSERNQNSLAGLVDQLARVRLHLGFFSLNVKQAAYALTAFGPIISGLIGAFSSLVGLLGSGLVGALGLAGAAMGGFALSAAGIGLALKPLIKEFTTATGAASDYYEQVIETGKGSEEAQDKLAEYQTVLKNLPPETRAAVVEFGKMRASWMKVSDELRKPFFNLMTEGMGALNSLMPMFQRNTERAFGAASKGVRQWISGLRGPEAKTIMDTLMNRMISATPALMSGIGNIATAFGRLSQAASRALPGVMSNFENFTKSLADRTAADGFAMKMNEMMDSLRSIGRLASSAGRLMITFFSTGADAGKSLADQITQTFNRWTRWMRSVSGQQSLKRFFEESVTEIGSLYDILSPMAKTFARFVQTMRPVSMAFQRLAAVILSVVDTMMQIPGVAQLIASALAAKMLLGIAGTVKSLAFAFGALRTKMLGTAAASATFSTSMAQMKMAATGVAASTLPGVAKQTTVAASGMSRLAMAGRGLLGVFGGPWGVALSAATLALVFFGDDLAKAFQGAKSLDEALVSQQESLRNVETAGSAASNSVLRYRKNVENAETAVKKYNAAVKDGATLQQQETLYGKAVSAAKEQERANQTVVNSLINYKKAVSDAWHSTQDASDSIIEYAEREKRWLDNSEALQTSLKNGTLTVARYQQLFQKEFGRRDTISPEFRKSLQEVQAFKLSKDLRLLNQGRIFAGMGTLSADLGRPFKELIRGFSGGQLDRLMAKFSLTSKGAMMNIIGLGRQLQQVLGPRGFPAGRNALTNILQGFDPRKPQATIRALQRSIKELSGQKAKPIRLDVKKDPITNAIELYQKFRGQVQKGVRGKLDISNLVATQAKTRDLLNRLNELDGKNPHVKVSIDPVYTGTWTKKVTIIEDKIKRAEGGPVGTAMEQKSRTQGGRYAAPTFLVGEERRPEFVIATNPAYRQDNMRYWMQAGAALGVPGFAAGFSPVNENKPHTAPLTKPPFKIKARGYGQLKELIQWSQAETDRSRAFYENEVNAGRLAAIPFDLIGKDLERTKALTQNLDAATFKRIQSLQSQKNKQDNILASNKSSKRDKEKAKEKKKDLIEKIKELKKERRLDIPQALSDIQTEIEANATEQMTGGAVGVTPALQQVFTAQSERYAAISAFGSNVGVGTSGYIGDSGMNFLGGRYDTEAMSSTANRSAGAGKSAAKTVNITNNYQEPPADPHTWSKNLAWEMSVG